MIFSINHIEKRNLIVVIHEMGVMVMHEYMQGKGVRYQICPGGAEKMGIPCCIEAYAKSDEERTYRVRL